MTVTTYHLIANLNLRLAVTCDCCGKPAEIDGDKVVDLRTEDGPGFLTDDRKIQIAIEELEIELGWNLQAESAVCKECMDIYDTVYGIIHDPREE
jgi:hypothetical protein